MKRLIDGADLAGKLRTRKANAVGHTEAMDAYETAMNDAIDAQEITLNALRDEVYEDAVKHGLWEDVEKDSVELSEDEPQSEREKAYTFHRRVFATKLVFFEADELLSAAEEEDWDGLQEELADVVIQALSTAGYLKIDIDAAVRRKIEFNKTRPWKHEGEKHDSNPD